MKESKLTLHNGIYYEPVLDGGVVVCADFQYTTPLSSRDGDAWLNIGPRSEWAVQGLTVAKATEALRRHWNKPGLPVAWRRPLDHPRLVRQLAKPAESIVEDLVKHPEKAHMDHMAMALAGEAGEIIDAIKQYTIYGKARPDDAHMKEEVGDALFYLQGLAQCFGFTLDEARIANIAKLSVRYSNLSYSNAAAQERADKQ